eukprot:1153130-Karenia_brevis.AAC.1
MVKTFGKWTSEAYPTGWQIIPQGNPFISKGIAKWKVIAAQDPPYVFPAWRKWGYFDHKA